MSLKSVLGLAAGAMMFATIGCTSAIDTVRGQNPAGPQADGVQQAGFSWGSNHGDCPQGGGDGCGWGGHGRGWYPTHHHTYDYKRPEGLVYPPANQPAAVVQYPYYTVKGPSDFFMK